jgi:hypothetical protein
MVTSNWKFTIIQSAAHQAINKSLFKPIFLRSETCFFRIVNSYSSEYGTHENVPVSLTIGMIQFEYFHPSK